MSDRRAHCYCCHRVAHIDQLDAKPFPTVWLWLVRLFLGQRQMLRYAADRGYDFDHMECAECYGPGYEAIP